MNSWYEPTTKQFSVGFILYKRSSQHTKKVKDKYFKDKNKQTSKERRHNNDKLGDKRLKKEKSIMIQLSNCRFVKLLCFTLDN